jgi:hypothetical protein
MVILPRLLGSNILLISDMIVILSCGCNSVVQNYAEAFPLYQM